MVVGGEEGGGGVRLGHLALFPMPGYKYLSHILQVLPNNPSRLCKIT